MKNVPKYYRNKEMIKDIDPDCLWILKGNVLRHVDIDCLTEVDYASNVRLFYEYLPPSTPVMECNTKELLAIINYYWLVIEEAQQLASEDGNENLPDDLEIILCSIDTIRLTLTKQRKKPSDTQKNILLMGIKYLDLLLSSNYNS